MQKRIICVHCSNLDLCQHSLTYLTNATSFCSKSNRRYLFTFKKTQTADFWYFTFRITQLECSSFPLGLLQTQHYSASNKKKIRILRAVFWFRCCLNIAYTYFWSSKVQLFFLLLVRSLNILCSMNQIYQSYSCNTLRIWLKIFLRWNYHKNITSISQEN